MNLLSIDLNLLVVFDALLRERHVGRAATAIGRSQPAVSHALSRLRALFGDPLLVASGRRMILSPRADGLREPLGRALRSVRGLFDAERFDAATSKRVFRLMMPDYLAAAILPALITKLRSEAPNVRLDVVAWRGATTLTREYLDAIDLVVSAWTGRFLAFRREPLLVDRDVLAVRATGSGRRVARARFLALPHVAVVGPGEHEDLVDGWLRGLGHTRTIAVTVPSYLLALHVVATSSLVAVVPTRLVASFGAARGIRAVPLPFDPGGDPIYLQHPAIADADPASLWLRRRVRDALGAGSRSR